MEVTSPRPGGSGHAAPVTAAKGRTGRRLAVITGAVLALVSLVAIGVGAAAVWAASGGRYVDLGAHGTYRTEGYALASDPANWRTEWFGSFGTIRLRAASADGKPVFVGLADPDAARRYLSGVRYTTVHGKSASTNHPGSKPPRDGSLNWTAQARGAGTQTLHLNAQDAGAQTLVVMNADGSPVVNGRVVSVAATMPGLTGIGAGLLGGGAVLLAGSVTLVVVPRRRGRQSVGAK